MLDHEKTAITRGNSKSAKFVSRLATKYDHILDFGAGKLRNSKLLKQRGKNVFALDTAKQVLNCEDAGGIPFSTFENYRGMKFDVILCSFVLSVCNPEEQAGIISQIKEFSHICTEVVFEVRTVEDVAKAKTAKPDGEGGYIMRGNTYQFPFTVSSLEEFLEEHFEVFEVKKYSGSIVAHCRTAEV